MVAYTGIQGRAADAAVQSDLNNFGKATKLAAVDVGRLPHGGEGMPQYQQTQGAYSTVDTHVAYCLGYDDDGINFLIVVAGSKSGNVFAYDSRSGIDNMGDDEVFDAGDMLGDLCVAAGGSMYAQGYLAS